MFFGHFLRTGGEGGGGSKGHFQLLKKKKTLLDRGFSDVLLLSVLARCYPVPRRPCRLRLTNLHSTLCWPERQPARQTHWFVGLGGGGGCYL